MLKELDIKTMGKMLAILNLIIKSPALPPSLVNYARTLTIKLLQIHSEMVNRTIPKIQNRLGCIYKIIKLPLMQLNIQ